MKKILIKFLNYWLDVPPILDNKIIPDIEKMHCKLNKKFHVCDVHRCSTYGCLNCGQYVSIKINI